MKKLVLSLVFIALSGVMLAQSTYMVADFSEKELDVMLDLCQRGGFEYLLERTPFSTYGHYQWNPKFAANDKTVARMVQKAEAVGVHLGLLVQPEAISENDPYFVPKYSKHFLREDQVQLFDKFSADECDIALRRNDILEHPSTLNLLLVDKELISYGTLEFSGDIVLLHHCTRGMYGTKSVAHDVNAEAYKIWDSPGRFVAPDTYLLDSVRYYLNQKIESSGVSFVMTAGEPGQELLDESIRVRQAERWNDDRERLKGGSLGWIVIHAADKKRVGTSMDDVEWMMAKAAAFEAGYGLMLDAKAIKNHGGLSDMLEKMKQWDQMRQAGVFTDAQKEALRDPYLDWHLTEQEEEYVLYPMNLSRRYRCIFEEQDPGVLASEKWEWKTEEECRFGLRLQVDGKVPINFPMINTEKGLVMFPCEIKPGQRLVYDFEDVAYIMDSNYNKLEEVVPEGLSMLPEGASEVYFICEVDPKTTQRPEVTIRYATHEQPIVVKK